MMMKVISDHHKERLRQRMCAREKDKERQRQGERWDQIRQEREREREKMEDVGSRTFFNLATDGLV